jgi:uncharacterized protein (DUF4415 family)
VVISLVVAARHLRRLNADEIAWFKKRTPGGKGYQSDMNAVLRTFVAQKARSR